MLDEAAILHRQASQRADQHDAHLTALSAIAVAGGPGRQDLFLDVGASIQRFYPRIRAIDLVSISGGAGATTRPARDPETDRIIREAAMASTGKLMLRPGPGVSGDYLLVKRSPNKDAARFGLSLEVDAGALIDSESPFWSRPSVRRSLWLGDVMLSGAVSGQAVQFEKVLGSGSQPLVLRAAISPRVGDLLTVTNVVSLVVVVSLLYAAILVGMRQIARARSAERAARLHAQDARLAHASRVNALGEMASGLAHELTQPLTAILSQVQAGRLLSTRGEFDKLSQIFGDSESQAKRAAAILDRLRRWTTPGDIARQEVSVNSAVMSVYVILRAEATRAGIDLEHDLAPALPPVLGDGVEIEQVIFNLVRNAMDAVGNADRRRITVTTRDLGDAIVLTVSDTGPGVSADVRNRLFEPFVTDKSGGTGLGLALCQRLVERMGGEIELVEDPSTTRFRVTLPAGGQASESKR
ncbi:His Kinase A (phospho-acceptor) domain-containing protein [Bauldia litoralis]|uniref:histidine kinase n=1 Tax=Bauldia litoralis TaxID=665467 RepID=A0A1G6EPQ0_9HYPH|nr:His Kinase A (phospho-acceptor) domain-containing protein [Bauldia litoralis]